MNRAAPNPHAAATPNVEPPTTSTAAPSDAPAQTGARRWLSQDLASLIQDQAKRKAAYDALIKDQAKRKATGDTLIQDQAKRKAMGDTLIYDLVIVGSGYGGAMAAAELAGLVERANQDEPDKPLRICLLERGKEYLPGSFPSQMGELPGHVRFTTPNADKPQGFTDGLFDVRIGPDVCALVANGLGGGSLINAGVMEQPKWAEFPHSLPNDVVKYLENNYINVAKRLGAVKDAIARHPEHKEKPLARIAALKQFDKGDGAAQFRHAALTIHMAGTPEQADHVDPALQPCTLCGDCLTGCNVGAKKSLDTNLLVSARQRGVEIYTGASVLKLVRKKTPGKDKMGWELTVVYANEHARSHQGDPLLIFARRVILAAGALGSPEILHRSQNADGGPQFSARLGQQFSCNGDNIATFYNLATPVASIADEHLPITAGARQIGPTITSMLDVPASVTQQGFLVQDFAIPGPLKTLFTETVATANTLYQLIDGDDSTHHPATPQNNRPDPCAVNSQAMAHTSLVGIIGHDSASGVLRFNTEQSKKTKKIWDGTINITWPDARHGRAMRDSMDYLQRLAQGKNVLQAGGRLIPNPLWQIGPPQLTTLVDQPNGPVITVHPLGGCPIGADIVQGVVDDCGRVFNAKDKDQNQDQDNRDNWSGTLIVLDGSIIPSSLGANPALTIATLAQRAARYLRNEWNWIEPSPAPAATNTTEVPVPMLAMPRGRFRAASDCTSPAQPTNICLSERLSGKLSLRHNDGTIHPYIVELTLHYQEVELARLMGSMYREIELNPEKHSTLRLFDETHWESLRFASEKVCSDAALLEAELSGKLTIFNQEASSPTERIVRGGHAWFVNRGWRDMSQLAIDKLLPLLGQGIVSMPQRQSGKPMAGKKADLWHEIIRWPQEIRKTAINIKNIASHAGEVRRLDYDLRIRDARIPAAQTKSAYRLPNFSAKQFNGMRICGEKRLTYNRRANPLRQLMDLVITQFPGCSMRPEHREKPLLSIDLRFMALQEIPLAQITKQKNQVNALSDFVSFGLYILRLMLLGHVWTFRKPDPSSTRKPERLPQALPGLLEPEITEIDLAPPQKGIPVRVRLTRFHDAQQDAIRLQQNLPLLPPLVMIHGYSASGSTYAHPAIGTSMAEYFFKRGRDVWILDLRTSAGLPSATLPWRFEEAALADIPVAIAHIINVMRQTRNHLPDDAHKVDVFAHCIGAVMLSMAILTDPAQIETVLDNDMGEAPEQRMPDAKRYYEEELDLMQKSIRRIILSEKGPELVYTQDNLIRAWLMGYIRKLILPNDYQFAIQKDANLRDQLLDRWLNALPYPESEFSRENPFTVLPRKTPWVGFRHRMDALYARDFSAKNIPDHTLDYIDDLFGPLNLDTVSQAIHFVRFNKITDASGCNRFVSRDNLQKYWSKIEYTMSIHGEENGLADKETLNRMEALMKNANICFRIEPAFVGMGHQDTLIGKDNERVFMAGENFLTEALPQRPNRSSAPPVCDLPWLGPRIQATPDRGNTICVMSDPRMGDGWVVPLPVRCDSKHITLVSTMPPIIWATPAPSRIWTELEVDSAISGNQQWEFILPVMIYDQAPANGQGKGTNRSGVENKAAENQAPESKQFSAEQLAACLDEIQEQVALQTIKLHLVSRSQYETVIGASPAAGQAFQLCFAFGSCQYPAGMLDRPMAEASYARLAKRLNTPVNHSADDQPAPLKPELLLLLGDQIYSDATAGLLDPSRADARYLRPHEDWLRMAPVREVMRHIPVYCMLDDHEIVDNWEPNPADPTKPADNANLSGPSKWPLEKGRATYLDLQPRFINSTQRPNDLWVSFEHNGIPFFMADSRTMRDSRNALSTDQASILGTRQMKDLQDWLLESQKKNPGIPKIISTASRFLPRQGQGNSALLHLDGWDGFPSDQNSLLAFIVKKNIPNVILLSGDEHISFMSQSQLDKLDQNGKPSGQVQQLLSLHCSGLYSPFPFANAMPADIPASDTFEFSHKKEKFLCHTNTTFFTLKQNTAKATDQSPILAGDGYLMVKLCKETQQENAKWKLQLFFDGSHGQWHWQTTLPG